MWFILAGSVLAWKDRTLALRASRVETLLNSLPDQRTDMLNLRLDELVGILPEGQLIQIVNRDGRRLFPIETALQLDTLPVGACAIPWIRTARAGNDNYRQLCHPVLYAGSPAYLTASTALLEDEILLSNFTSGLYKMIPVILLVSSIGGYSLSRRALRPVNSLIAEARRISANDLARRLPLPAAHDELRQLALEWNSLLARIQASLKRTTQFTADASHELRNPIAYIRTTAEFSLENPGLDAETREALREIVEETHATSQLLDNLLTLARADSGQVLFEVEEIDVASVIKEAYARVAPLAIAKEQHFHWEIAEGARPSLRMNSLHLRRLLIILMENAVKFTDRGGDISVFYDTKDNARLRVTDNGIGIAAEDLPRVFDRFYRVDAARSDTQDGVGLGLSIAKWIAELYSGSIVIESQVGEGTTTIFSLPEFAILDDRNAATRVRASRSSQPR